MNPVPTPHFTDDQRFCRICKDDESEEQLITPCKCAGSIRYVHNSCLYCWVDSRNQKNGELCSDNFVCEICKERYAVIIVKSYELREVVKCEAKMNQLKCLAILLLALIITLFGIGFMIYK